MFEKMGRVQVWTWTSPSTYGRGLYFNDLLVPQHPQNRSAAEQVQHGTSADRALSQLAREETEVLRLSAMSRADALAILRDTLTRTL
jgi:hypothetical protein